MAGKAKAISQIKQLLHLHQQGNSIKHIARSIGISKNMVKSYLVKLSTGKLPLFDLMALEDPVQRKRHLFMVRKKIKLQIGYKKQNPLV